MGGTQNLLFGVLVPLRRVVRFVTMVLGATQARTVESDTDSRCERGDDSSQVGMCCENGITTICLGYMY